MLPIHNIFDELSQVLPTSNAIVIAPPGAGKSTSLPLFLLNLPQFATSKIIMLQPRRIAARNIALYLSEQLGEAVGNTVGYRVRGDNKVSKHTRLEIITEGVLTRMLQSNPELPGIDLLIFDEFHERSIHADFSLALSIEVQQGLREDLRLLVMSATLDSQDIQKIMPNTPVLHSTGRSFEVDINYAPMSVTSAKSAAPSKHRQAPIITAVYDLFGSVFEQYTKDFLVFLPGAFEIKSAAGLLQNRYGDSVAIHCLFSDVSKDKQQTAIRPDKQGRRKIVLATNIAETSVTIDGIEVVIDSGLEKVAVFDIKRGVTQLRTQSISQASATQRAGRAGRLMPGSCYRMWSKEAHGHLDKQSTPEILQSDISELVLEATIWGTACQDLALIDIPSAAQLARADDTLNDLAIFNQHGKVSALGKKVHALGGQLNIAMLLVKSADLSEAHQSLACAIAAVLEAKDPLSQMPANAELSLRLRYLQSNTKHPLWQNVRQWHQKLKVSVQSWPLDDVGLLLAFGFTSWIGKYKGDSKFSLANGAGASLNKQDTFADALYAHKSSSASGWAVIANMQLSSKNSEDAIIRYAEPLRYESLQSHFAHMFSKTQETAWDDGKQRIRAFETSRFGNIVLQQTPLPKPSKEQTLQMWQQLITQLITQKGIDALPLEPRARQFLKRVQLFNAYNENASLLDLSPSSLLTTLDQWLLPYLEGKTSWQALSELSFYSLLSQVLDYAQLQSLNAALPESFLIPTKRHAAIEYRDNDSAFMSVRMQELYGMQTHPQLLNGKLPLTLELLSPAQRPIQTTQDIVSFWQGSYKEVIKEMKGRYPKHFWPDDPANAQATAKTKKKM